MVPSEDGQGSVSSNPYAYYPSCLPLGSLEEFKNLDDAANLDSAMRNVQSTATQNFVVDFSDETAYTAFDLSTTSVEALLEAERPDALATRWINVWYPYDHSALLETLAKRYDFSPRLLGLMTSNPKLAKPARSNVQTTSTARRRRLWSRRSDKTTSDSDLEKGASSMDELSEHLSISSYDSAANGNLYKIVNDLWHYSSIDLGRNYMCVGYNSLYGTKHATVDKNDSPLPQCVRVWTWLILCGDSTIISITEDPFPFAAPNNLDDLQLRITAETRRNLLNVFRSLSLADQDQLMTRNPMALLPIRARLGSTPEETIHRETDAPGLLFYYLFENWHNSYTLITRRESRYGVELNHLRAEMFQEPKLCHIDRLDTISKELGVLRRHYESYNRVIDRLLEPQGATAASLQNSRVVSEASEVDSVETARPIVTQRESMLGVSLSSAARMRFKRLRDLIDLYALNEIEEYIKQKDSLVGMNFNLIAIKESLDVERLTRITLLLTKATFLFLPVSLMTGYFSVPLESIEYGLRDYWLSFLVLFAVSWLALFVFGIFNGTVQTSTFLRGLWGGMKKAGSKTRAWAKGI